MLSSEEQRLDVEAEAGLLAVLQAYGISVGLEGAGNAVSDPGFFFRISTVITLTGGTMLLMWLGEQITSRGVGNGISLIIMAGIVAGLPHAIAATLELGRTGALSTIFIIILLAMAVGVVFFVVSIIDHGDALTAMILSPTPEVFGGAGARSRVPYLQARVAATLGVFSDAALVDLYGQVAEREGDTGRDSPAARLRLEAITHPRIRELWRSQQAQWRSSGVKQGIVVKTDEGSYRLTTTGIKKLQEEAKLFKAESW